MSQFHLTGDVERTIGLWGSAEPSLNCYVYGLRRDVVAMCDAWGTAYQQEAVAALLPNPEGSGGKLIWDMGRALAIDELQSIMGNLAAVNAEMAAARAPDEPGFYIGLSVKARRIIEAWVRSEQEKAVAVDAVIKALEMGGWSGLGPEWFGGFEMVLREKGRDYLRASR